jgi:hypothetical protein
MTETEPAATPALDPDIAIRRIAVRRLARTVKIAADLVAHCQQLASDAGNGDHLGPLSAAARLINSNARMAHALGHIALVERRQRTIIEHIRPPAVELNSTNENRRRSEIREDIGTKIDDALAADRRRRLLQPGDPHEEANLRLQEEEWNETHPQKRAMDMYRRFGRSLNDRGR